MKATFCARFFFFFVQNVAWVRKARCLASTEYYLAEAEFIMVGRGIFCYRYPAMSGQAPPPPDPVYTFRPHAGEIATLKYVNLATRGTLVSG